jgi:hypothetical protein
MTKTKTKRLRRTRRLRRMTRADRRKRPARETPWVAQNRARHPAHDAYADGSGAGRLAVPRIKGSTR